MRKFDGVFREGLPHEPDTWIIERFFNRPIAHFHDRNCCDGIVDAEHFAEKVEEVAKIHWR